MSCCNETSPPTRNFGQNESGRIAQLLAESKRCAVNAAIAKARATCCAPVPKPNRNVQSESALLESQVANCTRINAAQARLIASQPLRGVPESVRIAQLQQDIIDNYAPYNNPSRRFVEYQGPVIVPGCPPIATELSNGNVPKAPTSCTALALLDTGRP